ncbi:MAG: succinate dehydrogenase, partial [bacterium]|nr:succinate dehydrogenase [bacterium]
IFYFVGVAAASFHFGNGLWNFLVKWGITVGDRAQQVSMILCMILGFGVFAFFISSLYAFS